MPDTLAPGFDGSAMQLHELADEREADTEPSLALQRVVHPRKEIEDFGEFGGRYSDPIVSDGDVEPAVRLGSHRKLDLATVGRVFGCVADEIGEHLNQPFR